MKIGLIDLDDTGKFPNLALMKISAYHKSKGDSVEWYSPMFGSYDKVYVSKVFSWTKEFPYAINSKEVIYGGCGYDLENKLSYEVEHRYPDYSIYNYVKDTAYGFLTRGCPRGCNFCNVGEHQGRVSRKVANLKEFWNGQKNIVLLDPNILACKDWKELFQELIDSKAYIDFSQGLDIRLLTDERIEYINKLKIKMIHFAWDQYDTKTFECLKKFRPLLKFSDRKLRVYVLVNFNTTIEQDLDRIYKLRELGFDPYVMRYNKEKILRGSVYNKLARWVNNKFIWRTCEKFEDYNNQRRGK
ncbi:MAG: radical SAM protein [Paraclostridium sp.]